MSVESIPVHACSPIPAALPHAALSRKNEVKTMNKTLLTSMLALALLAPLASHAQSRSRAPDINPHDLEYSNVSMDLPDYDEPFQRDGRRLPTAQILSVVPGVTADQVRERLGEPLSTEDGARGQEWNYNLKLDIADEDYIVCQYKVVFEADNQTVRETSWRRYQCRLAMDTLAAQPAEQAPAAAEPAPVPAPVPAAPAAPENIELSGDFLFDFDKDLLSGQGAQVLDALVAKLAGSNSKVDIVGHTDRLGSVAYNQRLSEERARTVAGYLVMHGIAADRISTSGRGESEQVKQCEGERSTPELRACLKPNRRVAITITPVE